MTEGFRPGEIPKTKELRDKTGLGLREALDLLRRHNGNVQEAVASVKTYEAVNRAMYVGPEQKVRDLIKDFYKALHGGMVDEISARIKLSSLIEESLGMSYESWSKQQGV